MATTPASAQAPINTTSAQNALLIEAAKQEIAGQADAFNQLDGKTGVVLGFALVALAQILAGMLKASADSSTLHGPHLNSLRIMLQLGVLCFAAATVCGIIQRFATDFYSGAAVADLEAAMIVNPAIDLEGQLLAELKDCISKNEAVINHKAKLANASAFFTGAGLVVLVAATSLMIAAA